MSEFEKLEEIIKNNQISVYNVRVVRRMIEDMERKGVARIAHLSRMLRDKCPHEWTLNHDFRKCKNCGKVEEYK